MKRAAILLAALVAASPALAGNKLSCTLGAQVFNFKFLTDEQLVQERKGLGLGWAYHDGGSMILLRPQDKRQMAIVGSRRLELKGTRMEAPAALVVNGKERARGHCGYDLTDGRGDPA